MPDRRATTARTANALQDIDTIRKELDWFGRHIGDLDVIANSKDHQPMETLPSRAHIDTGPVLSETGQVQARAQVRDACRALQAMRVDATGIRVQLEKLFSAPGFNREMSGTTLEPGEIEAARAAQQTRVENEGDYRHGEWEAQASEEALSLIKIAGTSTSQRLCATCKTNWIKVSWDECGTCRAYRSRYKTPRPVELARDNTNRKVEADLDRQESAGGWHRQSDTDPEDLAG